MKKKYSAMLIGLSLVMASLEPVIIKLGFQSHVHPLETLVMRAFFSLLIVIPLAFFKFEKVERKNLPSVLVVCLLFNAINFFFYWALEGLSAIAVITLVTLTPAFVALVNRHRGLEVLGKYFWHGFALSFVGVLLTVEIITKGVGNISLMGLLFMALVILGSTLYRTSMDLLTQKKDPLVITQYLFLSQGVIAIIASFFVDMPWQAGWKYSAWLGLVAVLANISFIWAIKVLGATKISLWGILQRPLVIIISAIVLKEVLDWVQVIGILCVLLGIQLAKVKRVSPSPPVSSIPPVSASTPSP